jgi:hypothetical protein
MREKGNTEEKESLMLLNSAVLIQKAAAMYKTISKTICNDIDNLKDPHEALIFKMLFIYGKKQTM